MQKFVTYVASSDVKNWSLKEKTTWKKKKKRMSQAESWADSV